MWSFYIELFLVLVTVAASTGHYSKPCGNDQALQECLIQYAKGFASPKYVSWDDLKLHCFLDSKLSKCINRYLNKYSGDTFSSLAKATISYVIFEKDLKVCTLYNSKSVIKKLYKVNEPNDVKRAWRRKIGRLLHPGHIPKCAKELDMACAREYAQRMRRDQNLCANIPFKSQCLRSGYQGTCPARIVRYILDIFPAEAKKVLDTVCSGAQDTSA